MANPKIMYIFKRDYLSYERMKQQGVEFVILPKNRFEVVREFLPYNGDNRGKITMFKLV